MLSKVDWTEYGLEFIAGVDEVGRGCLAGPVYAAAVIIGKDFDIPGVTDSKLISEKKRAEIAEKIKIKSLAWSVGVGEVFEINKYNILQATFLAMRRALVGLKIKPELVLVDGNQKIPLLPYKQETLVKGDLRCLPISCASIVAKAARDRMMIQMEDTYPGYMWGKHKGYGTAAHLKLIQELGPTPIHRATFKGVKEWMGEQDIRL